MQDLSKISVVLPSLDPDEKLNAVIDGLLEYGFSNIILVNDGSKQENLHYFTDAAAAHPEIHLLHHEVNRGKGAALKTAFRWFLDNCPEGAGVVTVDGDNQHHPEDTRACCEKMLETGHCILGCRDFTLDHVPNRSRFGNHTTSLVFKTFVGMTISDTQTGLRALPREAVEELVDVAGDRFEYETNMLLAFKEKAIPFEENKIRTVYIEENKSSHFRTFVDSWRIYKLILAHFFRYTINSIVCAAVDTGLFTLFTALLKKAAGGLRPHCRGRRWRESDLVSAELLPQQEAGVQEHRGYRQDHASLLLPGGPPDAAADSADRRRVCAFPYQAHRRAAHADLRGRDDSALHHRLYDSAALGVCTPETK